MTLHSQTDFAIPEETIRVARAAYPRGNVLMKRRDAPGTIYQDQPFASLFPHNGRAVEAPWRLALITVLQFMEELPDRQAADAVRGRIDCRTDEAMTEQLQEELHQADLALGEHFVDAGYVSARVLVQSQERFGIEVVGPVSVDTQWQARTPSGIDGSTVRP
jgi:hypothetical protein